MEGDGVKVDVTIENIYKLVGHQVEVLDRLSSGPLKNIEEWHGLVRDIFLASGGLLSDKVCRAIRLMTEYGLYKSLYYIRRLYLMLLEEFPQSIRFYTTRGWITPVREKEPTTIQIPRFLEDEFMKEE